MAAPAAPPAKPGFAIPPKLHVFVLFMTEFIALMLIFGVAVPTLHEQGKNVVLLAVGGVLAFVALLFLLGALGKLVPVRCRGCRSSARFRGFGWWPFIYRYDCTGCGAELKLEVTGG